MELCAYLLGWHELYTSADMSVNFALAVLHNATLYNHSKDGRRERRLPLENLIAPAALFHLSYILILSVSLHILFISVPLGTSVFLPASSAVSVSLHLVCL